MLQVTLYRVLLHLTSHHVDSSAILQISYAVEQRVQLHNTSPYSAMFNLQGTM